MKTTVFISQSGERSLAIAEALKPFVRKLTETDPWISTGIPKGARWPFELADKLSSAAAGMVCLTKDNLAEPWVLFEAGALSRTKSERVWTVLLDLAHADVAPPLGLYQHTRADSKDDMRRMIDSINETTESPRRADDLSELFEFLWPKLHADLEAAKALPTNPLNVAAPRRDQDDVLAEMLELLRESSRVSSFRTEKTLAMMHQIYQAVLGEKAPPLAALRQAMAQPSPKSGMSTFVKMLTVAEAMGRAGRATDDGTATGTIFDAPYVPEKGDDANMDWQSRYEGPQPPGNPRGNK